MKQLTDKQRLAAYKFALKDLENAGLKAGLCFILADAAKWFIKSKVEFWDTYDLFPEFAKRKPDGITPRSCEAWFLYNECGYMMRVMLIDECIRELNQKLKGER